MSLPTLLCASCGVCGRSYEAQRMFIELDNLREAAKLKRARVRRRRRPRTTHTPTGGTSIHHVVMLIG